jgi:hypothetical protein
MSQLKPRVAIIGTAGRDKTKTMSLGLWDWMCQDALTRIRKGAHVVSGGAAWADHIAVWLFMTGHAGELTLHLPAPITSINDRHWFEGPAKGSAAAANYYHSQFGLLIGKDTIKQIVNAAGRLACHGTIQPVSAGYGAMFARNKLVSECEQMLAYTFGQGNVPADGGTKDTWDKCKGEKLHVSLPDRSF